MKKLLAGLASVLGAVACTQDAPYGSVVHYESHESTNTFFRGATARGPLFVDVHGSYPGYEASEVARLIADAMEQGVPRRPFKATLNLAEAHSPAYRVIWLIAPPKNFNSNRVCEGNIPVSEPQDKPTFAIVFCADKKVLREMTGWVQAETPPTAENFQKFVGVVARDLFK